MVLCHWCVVVDVNTEGLDIVLLVLASILLFALVIEGLL